MAESVAQQYLDGIQEWRAAKDEAEAIVGRIVRVANKLSNWNSPSFTGFYGYLSNGTLIQCDKDNQIPLDSMPTLEDVHHVLSRALALKQRCESLLAAMPAYERDAINVRP